MTFKLIGISGPARCGKDTAADFIIDKRPAYQKVSFADPIKAMLRVGFDMTDGQLYGHHKEEIDMRYGRSPRDMMQTLGTEWGRELVDGDIWVKAMEAHLNKLGGTFVIPDVRFENEADFIRKHGRLIHVRGRDRGIDDTHASEAGVVGRLPDITIHNKEDIQCYLDHVFEVLLYIEKWDSIAFTI